MTSSLRLRLGKCPSTAASKLIQVKLVSLWKLECYVILYIELSQIVHISQLPRNILPCYFILVQGCNLSRICNVPTQGLPEYEHSGNYKNGKRHPNTTTFPKTISLVRSRTTSVTLPSWRKLSLFPSLWRSRPHMSHAIPAMLLSTYVTPQGPILDCILTSCIASYVQIWFSKRRLPRVLSCKSPR